MSSFGLRRVPASLVLMVSLAAAVAAASDRGLDLPPVERVVLEGGTTVLLAHKRDVPLVSLQVLLRGGTRLDPTGQEGLGSLAVDALRKGAGDRDAEQLARELDGRGATLNTSADLTSISLSVDALAVDAEWSVALLADLVAKPRFADDEVQKLRDRAIESLKAARQQPQALIGQYFLSALYAGHPYGRPGTGNETTLAALDAAKVRAHWTRLVASDRLIIAVGGDFDRDAVLAALRAGFGGLPASTEPLPSLAEHPRPTARRVLLVDMPDAVQTYFWLGTVGIPRTYAHDPTFDLVRTAFGGRFTSMLNTALRIESGLTYGARLTVQQLEVAGPLAITSFTETSKTGEALDLALATLDRLHESALPAPVLASSRTYLRGQLPPTLETGHAVTQAVLDLERFGLPATSLTEYFVAIDRVTAKDVSAVIQDAFPRSDALLMVLIGNAAALRDLAKRYGPVAEKRLSDPSF